MTEEIKLKESKYNLYLFCNAIYLNQVQIQKEKSPIFSITIEIAQEKHHLHIFKYDTPSQIAYRFCIQNNWDLACVTPVSKKIQEVFEEYLRNPQLEHKLRRKLEQIIPNDSTNLASFQQKQMCNQEINQIAQDSQQQQIYSKDSQDLEIKKGMVKNFEMQKQGQRAYEKIQINGGQQMDQRVTNQLGSHNNLEQTTANNVTLNNPKGQNNLMININNINKTDYQFSKDESDQKMVNKNGSNSTLQSNSTLSRKYFNCNHITSQVQQKVIQKIEDKKQTTAEKKKRSISLDNNSSQSQHNFKQIPQLQCIQLSKDSSANQIQFSDIMSIPFKDANSIQFRDTHSTHLRENSTNLCKENLTDSRSFMQFLPNSKGQQNSNGKKDPYSKIMRESSQQNNNGINNQSQYFKGLKDSLSSSQTYVSVLKEIKQITNQGRKRESQSNGSRERQQKNMYKENIDFREGKNNSCEKIKMHSIGKSIIENQNQQQQWENSGKLINVSHSSGRQNAFQNTTQQSRINQQLGGSLSPQGTNLQIYERGVHFLDQKQNKIDQFIQNRKDDIMNTCTFIPKTNQKANQQLLQYRDKSIDPYDQLYQNSKVIKMKKDIIKNKLLTEESKEFSFKPSLNPISKMIVKTKRQNSISDNTSNFETNKSAKINQIQQEMLKECTFHPQISKNSEKMTKTNNPNLNVYERLYISTNKKDKKQSENYHCYFDANKNQQFLTYPDQDCSSNHVQNNCCQCGQNGFQQQNIQSLPNNGYNFSNINNDDIPNNLYNPSFLNNQNYSFSQDKNQMNSYQQVLGNGLLSSDFFNNSQQSNNDQVTQQNQNIFNSNNNNNGQLISQVSSINYATNNMNNNNNNQVINNSNNQLNNSMNIQNYYNTNNQNTANNLSLLNQSDLVVSSSQMNGSFNYNKDQFTNQSLDNIYQNAPHNNQVQQQQQQQHGQHLHTCSKLGTKDISENPTQQQQQKNLNSSSINSQGKKQCCSSINTMQSSMCSQKHDRSSLNESREKDRLNKNRRESADTQYKKTFSPNKNSMALMERKKKQRFEEIFILLDSDKDGLISAQNISIQDLPDEILVIIAPLLYELEDMDAELTLVEFIDAFERLYKQLPIIDKNKLLLFDTYQKWEQEKIYLHNKDLNFQPQINPQSEIIAQISRPERGTENLYDLYKNRDRQYEEKLMQKRREKENEINQQCTFHPNIIQSNLENGRQQQEPNNQINSCQKSFQEFLSTHAQIV